jgi:hypothetical protein
VKKERIIPSCPARRCFNLTLEILEGRQLPSGLLAALLGLNNDLIVANSSFQTDQATLAHFKSSLPPSNGHVVVGNDYDKTTLDDQRMISDSADKGRRWLLPSVTAADDSLSRSGCP